MSLLRPLPCPFVPLRSTGEAVQSMFSEPDHADSIFWEV